jgi:hypothetical protein
LIITSTPARKFVYYPDRKPTDLTDGNSRSVACLDSLPFQEGTPLAPTEGHTSTKVATTDSGLSTPDRQVFMVVSKTPGRSGTQPDRYLDDISKDEFPPTHPLMKLLTTRMPDVTTTGSGTIGADVSARLSPSRTSRRLWIKLPTRCTPPQNSASYLSPR